MTNPTRCALIALLLAAFAVPAQAYPTCFDWLCYTITKQCVFDAGCSEDSGSDALDFQWDFGDGATFDDWDQPLAGHIYSSGSFATVTLDVGYLFIGYDDVSCTVQFGNVVSPGSATYSGRCQ